MLFLRCDRILDITLKVIRTEDMFRLGAYIVVL